MLGLFQTCVYFSYLFLCYVSRFVRYACMSDEALHSSARWNLTQVHWILSCKQIRFDINLVKDFLRIISLKYSEHIPILETGTRLGGYDS